jgi:hypothetical protein
MQIANRAPSNGAFPPSQRGDAPDIDSQLLLQRDSHRRILLRRSIGRWWLPIVLIALGAWPRGSQVIERVYRKDELYSSEYLFCAPDLVVVFEPGYAPSPQSTHLGFDEATCSQPAAGTTVGRFLLACAPVLSAGVAIAQRVPLTAVVPSLLHALGVAYAEADSPAVGALFSPSYSQRPPSPK